MPPPLHGCGRSPNPRDPPLSAGADNSFRWLYPIGGIERRQGTYAWSGFAGVDDRIAGGLQPSTQRGPPIATQSALFSGVVRIIEGALERGHSLGECPAGADPTATPD